MLYYDDSWCQILYQRWSNPLKLQLGSIIVLQVWLSSWCIFNHARELKYVYNSIMTYDGYLWCQVWYQRCPYPPKLQSGTINIMQVWQSSRCTTNYTRELKIFTQLKIEISYTFMVSNLIPKMNQSTKTPVQSLRCPPCMIVFLVDLFSC